MKKLFLILVLGLMALAVFADEPDEKKVQEPNKDEQQNLDCEGQPKIDDTQRAFMDKYLDKHGVLPAKAESVKGNQ